MASSLSGGGYLNSGPYSFSLASMIRFSNIFQARSTFSCSIRSLSRRPSSFPVWYRVESFPLFILNLPDPGLGMPRPLGFLLEHKLNCFIADARLLQIGYLLRRKAPGLPKGDRQKHDNQKSNRDRTPCAPDSANSVDKAPKLLI